MSDIQRRVNRLEAKLQTDQADTGLTLEQTVRLLWQADPKDFRALTQEIPAFQRFLERFEREEAQAQRGGDPGESAE